MEVGERLLWCWPEAAASGQKVAELVTKDTNPDEVVSLIVGAETVRK